MITDAEFWMEERRKASGGDAIFKGMLALLHTRQVSLNGLGTSLAREELTLRRVGKERRDAANGHVFTAEEKKRIEEAYRNGEKEMEETESSPAEMNKAFLARRGVQPRRVASSCIRVLQQIMMFAVPIYALRYNVPAMSMSWNTSCFIDRQCKQLITFGAGHGVKVPQHLFGRGCVAGDGFFAVLTNQDEVWASGGLKVSTSSASGPAALGREEVMTGIAGKILMLVGHGQRLASVTRAFTVRPLSALSNSTRSVIPSRHVRFLDLGYGEDYYMVGTDSVVYKTTASKRAVSTPRRVMTLCRTPVSRVASGTSFLLIIDQNGGLLSLGRNKKGQLGNGEKQDAHRKPFLQVALRHHFFVQVAAGDCHSLALTSSGIVYGSGSNESGQLGLGASVKSVSVFTLIPLPSKCVGIAAGPAGSMFACENGEVLTCGLNDCMQLGLNTVEKIVYAPTLVPGLQFGVESYTMDFGGYRFPEPTSVTSPHPPTEPASSAPNTQVNGSPAAQEAVEATEVNAPPPPNSNENHNKQGSGQVLPATMDSGSAQAPPAINAPSITVCTPLPSPKNQHRPDDAAVSAPASAFVRETTLVTASGPEADIEVDNSETAGDESRAHEPIEPSSKPAPTSSDKNRPLALKDNKKANKCGCCTVM